MSGSAVPGSLGFGEVLPGGAALKSARAVTDDKPFDTEAYRRGDPAYFGVLVKRFGPLIRKIAKEYSEDGDEREGMYQEACIRLLTRAKDYRESGTFEGWVVTITRGVCRNRRTSRAARASTIDRYSAEIPPVEESAALLDDPSRLLQYRLFLERLERALAELPGRQATAWRLVHIEGYSPKQAAREMGTKPETVRSNIRHARARLRELMEDARDDLS